MRALGSNRKRTRKHGGLGTQRKDQKVAASSQPLNPPREESSVFADLEELCRTPGYVHALSYLIFRDGVVTGGEEFKKEDFEKLYSKERLIRTEIEVLLGLWLKGNRETDVPEANIIQEMIERSDALLAELHAAMLAPAHSDFSIAMENHFAGADVESPLGKAAAMREAIFYSGESAFSSQYLEFSATRYSKDVEWLRNNFQFNMSEAESVFGTLISLMSDKFPNVLQGLRHLPTRTWTMLPLFCFTLDEIINASECSEGVVQGCSTLITL